MQQHSQGAKGRKYKSVLQLRIKGLALINLPAPIWTA